jgi:hypothetical protein
MKTEILHKVKDLVKPLYGQLDCWVHRWPHIQDVAERSEALVYFEDLSSSLQPYLIASYCHDLGRVEEEKRKRRREEPIPHALLSIEPTVGILQGIGIRGIDFNSIVEAVTVHSYRVYKGENNIARILQDADKMSGLSSWGIVALTKYFAGKDYINGEDILNNWRDKKKIRELSDFVLSQIEKDIVEKVMTGLKIVTEWYDMFHTESARKIVQEDYEYLIMCRKHLSEKFGLNS